MLLGRGHHVVLVQPDTQCGCEIAASRNAELLREGIYISNFFRGEAGGSRDRVPITQTYGDFRQLRYGAEVTVVSIEIAFDVF